MVDFLAEVEVRNERVLGEVDKQEKMDKLSQFFGVASQEFTVPSPQGLASPPGSLVSI